VILVSKICYNATDKTLSPLDKGETSAGGRGFDSPPFRCGKSTTTAKRINVLSNHPVLPLVFTRGRLMYIVGDFLCFHYDSFPILPLTKKKTKLNLTKMSQSERKGRVEGKGGSTGLTTSCGWFDEAHQKLRVCFYLICLCSLA